MPRQQASPVVQANSFREYRPHFEDGKLKSMRIADSQAGWHGARGHTTTPAGSLVDSLDGQKAHPTTLSSTHQYGPLSYTASGGQQPAPTQYPFQSHGPASAPFDGRDAPSSGQPLQHDDLSYLLDPLPPTVLQSYPVDFLLDAPPFDPTFNELKWNVAEPALNISIPSTGMTDAGHNIPLHDGAMADSPISYTPDGSATTSNYTPTNDQWVPVYGIPASNNGASSCAPPPPPRYASLDSLSVPRYQSLDTIDTANNLLPLMDTMMESKISPVTQPVLRDEKSQLYLHVNITMSATPNGTPLQAFVNLDGQYKLSLVHNLDAHGIDEGEVKRILALVFCPHR